MEDIDSDDDEEGVSCDDAEERENKRQQRDEMNKKISKLAAECPTNIKDPNFSCWGTISAVAKVVLKHWLPLLFMSQKVIETEKSGSYLHVIATKLEEL